MILGPEDVFPIEDDVGNANGSSPLIPRLDMRGQPVAWPYRTGICTTQTKDNIIDA